MPAKPISEKIVKTLEVPAKGNRVHFFSGATLQGKKAPSGFGVRVTSAGTKSFVLFHRAAGRKFLETVGRWDDNEFGGALTVHDAIVAATKLAKELRTGERQDPRPERTRRQQDGDGPTVATVSDIFDQFVARYVRAEAKLRSGDMIEDQLERLAKPAVGHLGIYEIRRSHVVGMLDTIADGHGPVMADRVLAYVRKCFNWYATRDDEFTPPIVRGMARTKPKERKRKRVLDDQEIRDLWAGLDRFKAPPCFVPFVKSLLLCATRRTESAAMASTEIDGDVWTIPAARYKTKLDHVVPLSQLARALIGQKPAGLKANSWFIFSTTGGKKAFSGYSKAKRELDALIDEIRKADGRPPMPPYVFHDLRRTARSLMSRAKVPTDHAERALGHVMGGVRETYDRYEYFEEKRAAFVALAAMVERILKPGSNVLPLKQAGIDA